MRDLESNEVVKEQETSVNKEQELIVQKLMRKEHKKKDSS
jgi:hypothetical protein